MPLALPTALTTNRDIYLVDFILDDISHRATSQGTDFHLARELRGWMNSIGEYVYVLHDYELDGFDSFLAPEHLDELKGRQANHLISLGRSGEIEFGDCEYAHRLLREAIDTTAPQPA